MSGKVASRGRKVGGEEEDEEEDDTGDQGRIQPERQAITIRKF